MLIFIERFFGSPIEINPEIHFQPKPPSDELLSQSSLNWLTSIGCSFHLGVNFDDIFSERVQEELANRL